MNKKYALTWFLLLWAVVAVYAGDKDKTKPPVRFKLPAKATSRDYIPGKIVLRLKENARDAMQIPTRQGVEFNKVLQQIRHRAAQGAFRTSEVATQQRDRKAMQQARTEPIISTVVDLSLLYEIDYDPAIPIGEAINRLYASGMIEYAEPVYIERATYTPNDPNRSMQYYLSNIRAFEAWDISKGDTSVVIAIVDSGIEYDHPDIAPNLKYNYKDPVDGRDNDNDGFVDNFRGWDFVGTDYNNFKEDNNAGITGKNNAHGLSVAGCASASTDNGTGMAGIGFKCKILPLKHAADDDTRASDGTSDGIYRTAQGVLYAAQHGADIINCSFGSDYASQFLQDIYTYAALEKGCLIVAAAGNDGQQAANYPAAYDYVLSVASSSTGDTRSSFSNFDTSVDLIAPGSSIHTLNYGRQYTTISGTSFSSPIVAGAAGLVKSMYKNFSGLQIGELLRMTSDDVTQQTGEQYLHKLGKGRLNIQRALTEKPSSIRLLQNKLLNRNNNTAVAGDTALFYGEFINYLWPTSPNLSIRITTDNPYIKLINAQLKPGSIGTMQKFGNNSQPLRFSISANIPKDSEVVFRIEYTDDKYIDYQYFKMIVNPSYYIINKNNITSSVGSIGRIGYEDPENQAKGVGFLYEDDNFLYEMGLMLGTSAAQLSSSVRNDKGGYDEDFKVVKYITEGKPSRVSAYDLQGAFNDLGAGTSASNVLVDHKTYVWKGAPNDKYFIVEYTIKNQGTIALNRFYAGLFADWDVGESGENRAAWDEAAKLAYVHGTGTTTNYAGIKLLTTGKVNHYAIDNDHKLAGNPLGVYDGFTDAEKYTSLSGGKATAGTTGSGTDVSHVLSSGPHMIAPKDSITIAFAIIGGSGLSDLQQSAAAADRMYNQTMKAAQPKISNNRVCYGQPATLTATGAQKINWYADLSGGSPVATGTTFTLPALTRDTVVYAANADNTFESIRTRVEVNIRANPAISLSGNPRLCGNQPLTLTAAPADEYLWSNGATTRSIAVSQPGAYSVKVKDRTLGCENTSQVVTVTAAPATLAKFRSDMTEIAWKDNAAFSFFDESTNAVAWLWNFGDGSTSTERNPKHTFSTFGSYNVTLTVTSPEGCTSTATALKVSVTGLEDQMFSRLVSLYPNPNRGSFKLVMNTERYGKLNVVIYNALGKEVQRMDYKKTAETFEAVVDAPGLPGGLYFVHIDDGTAKAVKRMVVE